MGKKQPFVSFSKPVKPKFKRVELFVEELGGVVFIKQVSIRQAHEIAGFSKAVSANGSSEEVDAEALTHQTVAGWGKEEDAKFLSMVMEDEDGNSPSWEDIIDWPHRLVALIAEPAKEINGLTAPAKEGLEKN